jgi:antitoxin component YwqK of YwqJK toxin-antitoxin module
LTSCDSQTPPDKNEIDKAVDKGIKDYFENPKADNEQLDPVVIKQFVDSGQIINGIKEGVWTEYSVDSSSVGKVDTLKVGEKQVLQLGSAAMKKSHGLYTNGKKDGVWSEYSSSDKKAPIAFTRQMTITYNAGLKNGNQTIYLLGTKVVGVFPWKNNIEEGIKKIYDLNYPNNLAEVYEVKNGHSYLRELYYKDGQLKFKSVDTTINKSKFTLHKYYHENGQLWTESLFKGDKHWSVLANYDSEGNKKDPGTLKNGNGTLKTYDGNGTLTKTFTYVDGEEK